MLRVFGIFLLFINLALFYQLVASEGGINEYRQMRKKYESTQLLLQNALDENKKISYEIKLLRSNPEYIQQAIRKEMRLLRDNELLYMFD